MKRKARPANVDILYGVQIVYRINPYRTSFEDFSVWAQTFVGVLLWRRLFLQSNLIKPLTNSDTLGNEEGTTMGAGPGHF